jgi:hypothetical protein
MLLAASLVFYGWWSPPYLVLLAAIVAISWAGGLALERWRRAAVLSAVLGLELGLLVYFKYAGFAAQNAQRALASLGVPVTLGVPDIVLPVGISFMIFQGMGYTIDVYRRELHAERSFLFTTLFLSYFPQLVAGPIERAAHLIPQLRRMEGRWFDTADWPRGTFLILKGVFFKFVIADNMAVLVDDVYADPIAAGPADIAAAVLGFSIQIYGDFYGFLWLHVDRARQRAVVRDRVAAEFRPPVPGDKHPGILETVAHFALAVVPRLRLHSARRQPRRTRPPRGQPSDRHARRRALARRQRDVRPLGCPAWSHARRPRGVDTERGGDPAAHRGRGPQESAQRGPSVSARGEEKTTVKRVPVRRISRAEMLSYSRTRGLICRGVTTR